MKDHILETTVGKPDDFQSPSCLNYSVILLSDNQDPL